jgi:site-specific recombinase XerD
MVQNGTWEWLLEGFKLELETQVKAKTVDYYYSHARYFALWAQNEGKLADPRLVTKRDIQSFFHYLVHNKDTIVLGNGARRQIRRGSYPQWHHYRCLVRFFTWAVNEGYLGHSPLDGIKLKAPKDPPIEPWRPGHIDRFFEVLDHDWKVARTPRQRMLAERDEAILSLFLESGLRLGELAGLEVEDVDLDSKLALVRNGKMGKGRWTGFGARARKSLWRYLGLRQSFARGNAVWITEEGQPLTQHGIQEVFRRLKRDAGLQHVRGSIHKLRHTWATTYLGHTHDLKGTKILLGHSTYVMVDRYTAFIDAHDALRAYQDSGPLDWMRGKGSK